jgi:Uma2 family endonuclease
VEIVEGVVVAQASPSYEHGYVQGCLFGALNGAFRLGRGGPGGWWIAQDLDVRFTPHDIVRPDLAGWRRERLATVGKRPIDVVPDWVCEVLSPSTRSRDRGTKMSLYARYCVPYCWLVEPFGAIEAYALEQGRWVRLGWYERGTMARIPPVDAVELPVAEMFPPEQPLAE